MKKRLIILFTMLFIFVMAVPVMAQVNLNVNGKMYNAGTSPQIEAGITMVPVNVVARTLGAELTIQEKQIVLNKNDNILKMTEGNLTALYNGKNQTMPQAPKLKAGEMLVPLRFVCESFSAEVSWQGESQTIAIQYQEKRNGMSADEMLGKSSQALTDANTYKMKLNMDMTVSVQARGEENKTMNMNTKSQADCSYQAKPMVMYMQQQVSGSDTNSGEKIDNIKSEMLMNEKGMFMTMPETGWVKMDIPGLDIKALMEQAGSQDVMGSIMKMKEAGVLLNYSNDASKDGQNYWVLNVTMSPDSFQNYVQSMMKQLPAIFSEQQSADNQPDLNDLLKNMKVDMFYQMWIEQKSFLPKYIDLNAKTEMNMKTGDGQNLTELSMKMNQNAGYEMYDFGGSFTVPDVSSAISMTEYMEKTIGQATQESTKDTQADSQN